MSPAIIYFGEISNGQIFKHSKWLLSKGELSQLEQRQNHKHNYAMALEPINYTSRSREIEQEYLSIVKGDNTNDTTWLIIGPNQQKEYGPESTGNNFTDFLQSFDETKVQFGFARVSPPGSDVFKNILVGWCPDMAPMKMRASFAANFATVANNVFKGYHIQVTARDEDDLDEQELLSKVSNAAGARYSIQSSTNNTSKSTPPPVKKTFTPTVKKDIPPPLVKKDNPLKDDDDWDEPEVEERDLDTNPLKPSTNSNYKPIGKVNLSNLISQESSKEDPRIVKTLSHEDHTKINPSDDIANLKQNSKLQRDYEIDSFLKDNNFKQQHNDKVIKGFHTEKSPAQLWAERKAKQNVSASTTSTSSQPQNDEPEHEDVKDLKSKFEHLATEEESIEPKIIQPKKFVPPVVESAPQPTVTKNNFKSIGTPLPGMHNEDVDSEHNKDNDDDDWSDDEEQEQEQETRQPFSLPPRNVPQPGEKEEEEVAAPPPSLPSRNVVPEPEEEKPEQEEEGAAASPPALPSRNAAPEPEAEYIPPPPPRRNVEPEPEPEKPTEEAPWAIAEYDYEAGEENELTFAENDKIINIEFVDDDWWLGELSTTGEKGLFPSNYVALNGN